MTLVGRRALVTAGSRGIGAAIVRALHNEGADVFITGAHPDHLAETAGALGAVGFAVADFTHVGAATQAVEAATSKLGGIDILVSNTGGPRSAELPELVAQEWDDSYRLILRSAIELTSAVLPAMRAARWGRLVYITSAGVVRPIPGLHLSNVMRAGVAALARSIAAEVAPDGVTTHIVAPAFIDTDRNNELIDAHAKATGLSPDQARERRLRHIPVGRCGSPDEVGRLVTYLCSAHSGFQTGQLHLIDGGYTLI